MVVFLFHPHRIGYICMHKFIDSTYHTQSGKYVCAFYFVCFAIHQIPVGSDL